MKKGLLLLTAVAMLYASNGISQCQTRVFFEHFTQASCAPCAQQNPIFQGNILTNNKGRVLHVAHHTSWPGVDPMNAYNPNDVADRVNYYGVTGVPTMIMLGNKFNGSPASVTQDMVDAAAAYSNPIRILVDENTVGTTRNVTVRVQSVGTPPAGSYHLRGVVIESDITYPTPPGSNGETYFPNVYRKALPNTAGDVFSLPAQGTDTTFSYSYTLDVATWDTSKIYVIAWVQDDATKEVLQSGSSWDPNFEFAASTNTDFAASQPASNVSFDATYYNLGNIQENFRFVLTSNQPSDWSADFTYNSATYTDSTSDLINGQTSGNITLNVTPGNTPAVATYFLSMQSLDNPQYAAQVIQFHVISGITDLVVNNNGAQFEQDYLDALAYAGNTNYAAVSLPVFLSADRANALSDVNNIYFNVEWTFPSLTDENILALQNHMDNGGDMFISGQDIGWDTWDPSGNGTANTQAFYTNYMKAVYNADGSTANNNLTAETGDNIFGAVNASPVVDIYSGNMYPDELAPATGGQSIFYYNGDTTKSAGIRSVDAQASYKTVYMGVDMRMVQDISVRKEIIKLSHDWFYDLVSTEEYDAAINAMMLGTNYPNPANAYTIIPVANSGDNAVIELRSVEGRLISKLPVGQSQPWVKVSTENLSNGTYLYRLRNADGTFETHRMQVIH